MTLVSKEAVLAALERTAEAAAGSEEVVFAIDRFAFGMAKVIRSLPAHRWTDGEIEAAARILSQWVVVDRSETVERQKSALLADARAILDAAIREGGKP